MKLFSTFRSNAWSLEGNLRDALIVFAKLRHRSASFSCCLVLGLCLTVGRHAAADDEAPKPTSPVQEKADETKKEDATEDKKEDSTGKPSTLDKLTKELFKEIEEDPGKPKPQKEDDKFERVARGMRSASEKLDGKETGDETTKIQEQVIRDLDDLIKQLQNPPPNNGGGGGGGGGSSGGASSKSNAGGGGSRSQRAGSRGAKGQPQGGAANSQPQSGTGEAGGHERSNAEGSEERTDAERKAAAEAARRKKLEMDVWGHLPPHVREQLLNTYGERMLPKYEQLVKQFYEAVSEQNQSKPRR